MPELLKKYFSYIALTIVISLYIFFGIQHLGKFITADEHYWVYERIPQYWNAVAEGKWKKTFINDKPGVSLALVSGIGLIFEPHPENLCFENEEKIMTCSSERAENIFLFFRLPILIVNGLILLYLFWIIRKFTNNFIALSTVTLTALTPILLGINQIVNPDSLLWSFGSAALFTFFALLKLHEKKYATLSGIFLGFAVLSKYTASIFLPFFLFLIFIQPFFQSFNTSKENFSALAKRNLFFFAQVLALTIVVITLFLPAVWIKPSILLDLLLGGKESFFSWTPYFFFFLYVTDTVFFKNKFLFWLHTFFDRTHILSFFKRVVPLALFVLIIVLIVGRSTFPHWPLFEIIPFDLKDLNSSENKYYNYTPMLWEKFLLELNPLVFSLTPVTLLFFLWLLGKRFLFTKSLPQKINRPWDFEIFSLVCFFLIYIVILELSNVLAIPRYIIILYPLVAFLAAVGIWDFSKLLKNSFLQKLSLTTPHALTCAVIIFSFVSLNASRPFYLNYANSFLPKNSLISHAWGYGGYEAAQYLNSLPDAENLIVWSDYYGVCEFFKGQCVIMEYERSSLIDYDYYVVSYRGKYLYKPEHIRWLNKKNFNAVPAYTTQAPDWELLINERPKNFVRVVKVIK